MSTHRDSDELPEDLKQTHDEIEQAKRELRDDDEPSSAVGELFDRDLKSDPKGDDPKGTEPEETESEGTEPS